MTALCQLAVGLLANEKRNNWKSFMVCTHEGVVLQLCQEELTRIDLSQRGLVPRTVHMKRFEDQVAGTCSKNPNQFEFAGLVVWTKVASLRLNFEAEMASSRNRPRLVPKPCCRD